MSQEGMDGLLRVTDRHAMTATVVQVLEDRVVVQLNNKKQVYLAKKDQDLRDLYAHLKPEAVVVVQRTGVRDNIVYGRLLG